MLKLLSRILKEKSRWRPVSFIPIATEMTTQAAAELLVGNFRQGAVQLLILAAGADPFVAIVAGLAPPHSAASLIRWGVSK